MDDNNLIYLTLFVWRPEIQPLMLCLVRAFSCFYVVLLYHFYVVLVPVLYPCVMMNRLSHWE